MIFIFLYTPLYLYTFPIDDLNNGSSKSKTSSVAESKLLNVMMSNRM